MPKRSRPRRKVESRKLSPLEYMPEVARSDDWSRCLNRLEPQSQLCKRSDSELAAAREHLHKAAAEVLEKEASIKRKETPVGSIFYGIDAHSEQRRRWRKTSMFYLAQKATLNEVQLRRLQASGCSRYGFYADLWSRLTRSDDETDALFKKREVRLRKLMATVASNLLVSTTLAWREYVSRLKRARWLLARHVIGTEKSIFQAWRAFVQTQRQAKKVYRRVMLRLARGYFYSWCQFYMNQRFLRDILVNWKGLSNSALERRLKIARYMLRGSLERIFLAWRDTAIKEAKVRRYALTLFNRILQHCFHAWSAHTRTSQNVKAAFARMLAGCLSSHFSAWQRYSAIAKEARNFARYAFRKQCKRILSAWREQARSDHLMHLDQKYDCQATLASFYADFFDNHELPDTRDMY